jgi:hypothetical protein
LFLAGLSQNRPGFGKARKKAGFFDKTPVKIVFLIQAVFFYISCYVKLFKNPVGFGTASTVFARSVAAMIDKRPNP